MTVWVLPPATAKEGVRQATWVPMWLQHVVEPLQLWFPPLSKTDQSSCPPVPYGLLERATDMSELGAAQSSVCMHEVGGAVLRPGHRSSGKLLIKCSHVSLASESLTC